MIEKREATSPAWRGEALAVATLLLLVGAATGFRIEYNDWVGDYDRLTQFLPWYDYVGNALRDFRVPAWSPADGSGAPIAGSPATGWMFLPAMVVFPFFEAVRAYALMIVLHTLIAAVPMYAFARIIGLGRIGAIASAATYSIGPTLFAATLNQTGAGHVLMFIPLAMLATEMAIRSPRLSSQLGWAAIAGLSMANMYAGSPPRAAYGVAYVAGWLAYRWLIAPIPTVGNRRQHFTRVLSAGFGMGIFGATFAAAAVLPQLDFIAASNVANGDYSHVIGGDYASSTWTWATSAQIFLQGENAFSQRPLFQGMVLLLVAFLAVLLGRRRFGVPFFALAALMAFDLTTDTSLLRKTGYLIPAVKHFDEHKPTAVAIFIAFSISMLAGAGVHLLGSTRPARGVNLLKLLPLPTMLLLAWWMDTQEYPIAPIQYLLIILATIALFIPNLAGLISSPRLRQSIPHIAAATLGLTLLVFPLGVDVVKMIHESTLEPQWSNRRNQDHWLQSTAIRMLSDSDPGTAAEFLQRHQEQQQPFRYAPFTGTGDPGPDQSTALSGRLSKHIIGILANGRATSLGLQQIPAYNVVHFKEYVDYINVMNGDPQDYHFLDLMTPSISGSPLLDMLNVRYVLVPKVVDPQPPIARFGEMVYQDDLVNVYENPNAFARAWIVHDVQADQNGAELDLFNTGQVDGHVTAFVHGDLPAVSPPDPNGPSDSAVVTSYEPERIELIAKSTGDGLLVLSEVYDDGWSAWVDGKPVDILRTNHTLRGVPLAAGTHDVVLKYEPTALRIGLWSTSLSGLAMIGVWVWALIDRRKTTTGARLL